MIDINRQLENLLDQLLPQAQRALVNGETLRGRRLYDEALTLSRKLIAGSRSTIERQARERAHQELETRVTEELQRIQLVDAAANTGASSKSGSSGADHSLEDSHKELIRCMRYTGRATIADLIGHPDLKRALVTIAFQRANPTNVTVEAGGLLLFGPPGTGKTMAAGVLANLMERNFYKATLADLLSRWLGDSNKIINHLYRTARRENGVVFLDELDAIAGDRQVTSHSGAGRSILASLLTEIDGLQSDEQNGAAFTIAATNTPWDLDSAILSRFATRLYIPLPNFGERLQHLQSLCRGAAINDKELEEIAMATELFSGRELQQLVRLAKHYAIWRGTPDLELVLQGKRRLADAAVCHMPPLQVSDIRSARLKISPAANPRMLEKFQQYAELAT